MKKTSNFYFMKKHSANIITLSRIAFGFSLLFLSLSSVWFYILYLICGLTDMIDGTIARKTGTATKFGAMLDSVADFVFMLVCAIKILPQIHLPAQLWIWIIIIALIKIFNILMVFICKRKLLSIHSLLNKITGFALFIAPLSINFIENTLSIWIICLLTTIAAIQEVYFVAKGKFDLA